MRAAEYHSLSVVGGGIIPLTAQKRSCLVLEQLMDSNVLRYFGQRSEAVELCKIDTEIPVVLAKFR